MVRTCTYTSVKAFAYSRFYSLPASINVNKPKHFLCLRPISLFIYVNEC